MSGDPQALLSTIRDALTRIEDFDAALAAVDDLHTWAEKAQEALTQARRQTGRGRGVPDDMSVDVDEEMRNQGIYRG